MQCFSAIVIWKREKSKAQIKITELYFTQNIIRDQLCILSDCFYELHKYIHTHHWQIEFLYKSYWKWKTYLIRDTYIIELSDIKFILCFATRSSKYMMMMSLFHLRALCIEFDSIVVSNVDQLKSDFYLSSIYKRQNDTICNLISSKIQINQILYFLSCFDTFSIKLY